MNLFQKRLLYFSVMVKAGTVYAVNRVQITENHKKKIGAYFYATDLGILMCTQWSNIGYNVILR